MTAPFVGEVKPFAFNFPPRGYMFASGQLLPIAQYTALFSILGTTYGGNGTTNFALPNLNGAIPVGNGSGPGLGPVVLGETFGSETVQLLSTEMPSHSHTVTTKNDPSGTTHMTDVPTAGYFITRFMYHQNTAANAWYKPGAAPTATTLAPQVVTPNGGGQPHNNLQPLLVINWCIAVQGIFPSRN
ncbi:tail fiber protein [Sphingomonas sp. LB-2]|uniref:phage tail protein n=1 Tax=Sphingomonas caeni TaxID=2984949 RepID=UPI00222F9C05|nr:tail fiber protein [Sphingomonas caeni]MCW3849575.1 tail fiber protein [Sphingomonas caeni]